MRNRFRLFLGLPLAMSLVAPLAWGADPATYSGPTHDRKLARTMQISVSGVFSGAIGGEISLDGVRYQLTTNVSIYEIGHGPLPTGAVVGDRPVYLSGWRFGNVNLVSGVIVGSASEPTHRDEPGSAFVRLKDTSTPE